MENQNEKEPNIKVVVNQNPTLYGDDEISIVRVLHYMKERRHIYAWLMLACFLVGVCFPLVVYQIAPPSTSVSSVVTLNYEVPTGQYKRVNGKNIPVMETVTDLTAPDGDPLNLLDVTSSYVLQKAMTGLSLSTNLTAEIIRNNISIQKLLTAESQQNQELLSGMLENNLDNAYQQAMKQELQYDHQFIVTLTNGFSIGDGDSSKKVYLKDDELRVLLDRVLSAYNEYLCETYAVIELPSDEIGTIDIATLDYPDSLDRMKSALDHLYVYCEGFGENGKNYRSFTNGLSLNDLMVMIEQIRDKDVFELNSYILANNAAKDSSTLLSRYEYEINTTQSSLDTVKEKISEADKMLESYKNDEVLVGTQNGESVLKSTSTTDTYNALILAQAERYTEKSEIGYALATLNDSVEQINSEITDTELQKDLESELGRVYNTCHSIYQLVANHAAELSQSGIYSDYASSTSSLGENVSFLKANMTKMIAFGIAGVLFAGCVWVFSGFAKEMTEIEKRRTMKQNEKNA